VAVFNAPKGTGMRNITKAKWMRRGANFCWMIAHILYVPGNLVGNLGDRLDERFRAIMKKKIL
jgi:hypothetical protein